MPLRRHPGPWPRFRPMPSMSTSAASCPSYPASRSCASELNPVKCAYSTYKRGSLPAGRLGVAKNRTCRSKTAASRAMPLRPPKTSRNRTASSLLIQPLRDSPDIYTARGKMRLRAPQRLSRCPQFGSASLPRSWPRSGTQPTPFERGPDRTPKRCGIAS